VSEPASAKLAGVTVLVVEDEAMVSMLIEQMLEDLGATVVRASSISEAMQKLSAFTPHLAALDVNLRGEPIFPVAETLAAEKAPFVFITGYGVRGLPPEWADRPVVQKPFTAETLEAGLARALGKSAL
jgi:CheY-like chemotaxis protein